MAKKRILLLLLSVVMLLSIVTACSGNNGGNQQSSGNNSSGNTGGNAGGEETLEPVTFTFFNAGSSRQDVLTSDTDIGALYAEETGVSFQIEHLVGDVQTKIGTMIAGGEYPDVLVADTEIDKVVEAGGFIDLTDLIEQYGPNIKKVYGPYFDLITHRDGSIYFLPFSPQVGEYIPSPVIDQGAFWIQQRVLKEFNYPKIKTLDEYFDLIRQYAAKYPNEDLVGFTSLTHDWRYFAMTNPANHLAGYPNDGPVMVDMNTLEADDWHNNDEMKRWLKSLNDLYHDGLFDETSFVNNYDQYLAKLTSGKVLGYFDYGWQVNQASQNLKIAGDSDLEYFPLPIVFDANIKDQYLDPESFVHNRGIGITKSAKDPERIIKFFDYMLTEENQIRNQWGIQGLTYEVDENGRFYRTPEQIEKLRDNQYKQDVGLTYFEYYWPMWAQSSTLSDGNAHSPGRQPEVAQLDFTDAERAALEAYGVQTFSEMFSESDPRPWFPAWSIAFEQGSQEQIYEQRREDLVKRFLPRLTLADAGKFDSEWETYLSEFEKLGYTAQYEEYLSTKLKEKVAAVSGE
ncbi:extracellular solute-binding protein [Xylanibacillus composti]|uniref:ABC transporter substrate-binding protein n=1 Tax=Xylanibacillus composti TaxID=1572762 RepID=A0A8J4H3J6_9BACL|nr:ABC transporter substrate-binding protein [Xylanibacillus composti]MDT9727093.1 extracellular solute-binding protein [Xylanibacillus composti]GIQ68896.1 ABC transporter substrate-binding protein [Xylanibacillus composti]